MNTFEPVEMDFDEGLQRIRTALEKAGVDLEQGIVTSRDPRLQTLRDELRVRQSAEGFDMWQLPVALHRGLLFVSAARPNAELPEHRHVGRAVFRIVASGSIAYDGTELTVGDWMYVPKGQAYSFRAGPLGAVVFYPHWDPPN